MSLECWLLYAYEGLFFRNRLISGWGQVICISCAQRFVPYICNCVVDLPNISVWDECDCILNVALILLSRHICRKTVYYALWHWLWWLRALFFEVVIMPGSPNWLHRALSVNSAFIWTLACFFLLSLCLSVSLPLSLPPSLSLNDGTEETENVTVIFILWCWRLQQELLKEP